ncbi:TonB-dependent outer membrane receptor [Ameyamaea chiangmaiensis NBRC 103196]|uniref:TonB-dependent receptor n=1 Tax=Ameyamaea chiangmaiensis TaxID=442969 RepID=A0A850PEX0_9PROT|nr:TonB-dependent receptor [Ameyamaea chiangmaiensis]MBS4076116.1 TonB-dependent receptor [Ameyamaea chiangmaiensis]NVN39631.1 TonB-dependent receptor [Ameyamaea chiangmaiensis]GBQ67076.1 TonB-dependent outer membrane receptor [Ameyamaea chiangmaiensis NBRC 103196]
MITASKRFVLLAFTALCVLPAATVHAQSTQSVAKTAYENSAGEAVIVTGTRETGKKARESLNPIDVISARELARTGQTNVRDALMQLLPSVNHQTQGTTVGALTDSINLRGLSPNQTLILVNGKRRHTTTNIQTDAGPFRGSTPVDIDMIPMSMIDHIEVLRDGASAQYGSDAVAGVVNIILKSDDHGGTLSNEAGAYSAGDGFTENLNIDHGFALGSRGWLHAGLSYQHRERTDRTGVDTRTGLLDSHWIGDPLSDRISAAINAGYHVTSGIEAYTTLTYAHRNASTFQIYRLPSTLPTVYPNGFSPILGITENDYAATLGLRGGNFLGWNWDLSSTYGGDRTNIGMQQSANTGIYAATGATDTSFHLTDSASTQLTNDFDLKRSFRPSFWAFPVNVALGAEQRFETYSIGSGSYQSYTLGGSQAVPGVQPQSAGTHSRVVYGVYGDVSTHLTRQLQVDMAGRFEHYTDFGNTEAGKVAARYDITKWFGIRGTINNSIRAPTLAEEYHTSATVTTTGATGELAPSSPGAKLLGANDLKPERSTNVTAGFVLHPLHNLDIAVDAYQLDIRDRIMDGGTYSGAMAVAAFEANGRSLPTNVSLSGISASYLTNAASTRTRGVDITGNYRIDLGQNGRLALDVALNLNETSIRHTGTNALGRSLLNLQQIAYLTTDAPRNVLIFGGNWTKGRWNINLHEMRYGHIFDQMTIQQGANAYSTSVFAPYTAHARFITNLAVSYSPADRWTVTAGANNLFNTYPTRVPYAATYYGQAKYDRYGQQIGFNGGFYYMNISYRF